MVENQNKKVLNEMSEKTKVSNLAELPKNIANSIQPVLDVSSPIDEHKIGTTSANTSGTHNMLTTPSDKDFYLTAVQLSYQKDAACDSTVVQINCTPKGSAATQILKSRKLTLTAGTESLSFSLPIPVLLERASLVSITGTFTVGNMNMAGTCVGYTVDTLEK